VAAPARCFGAPKRKVFGLLPTRIRLKVTA
jgi:hypothetical protein